MIGSWKVPKIETTLLIVIHHSFLWTPLPSFLPEALTMWGSEQGSWESEYEAHFWLHNCQPPNPYPICVCVCVKEREKMPGVWNFGGKIAPSTQFMNVCVKCLRLLPPMKPHFRLSCLLQINPIEFTKTYFRVKYFRSNGNKNNSSLISWFQLCFFLSI